MYYMYICIICIYYSLHVKFHPSQFECLHREILFDLFSCQDKIWDCILDCSMLVTILDETVSNAVTKLKCNLFGRMETLPPVKRGQIIRFHRLKVGGIFCTLLLSCYAVIRFSCLLFLHQLIIIILTLLFCHYTTHTHTHTCILMVVYAIPRLQLIKMSFRVRRVMDLHG